MESIYLHFNCILNSSYYSIQYKVIIQYNIQITTTLIQLMGKEITKIQSPDDEISNCSVENDYTTSFK